MLIGDFIEIFNIFYFEKNKTRREIVVISGDCVVRKIPFKFKQCEIFLQKTFVKSFAAVTHFFPFLPVSDNEFFGDADRAEHYQRRLLFF